jgi:hypothetical protein
MMRMPAHMRNGMVLCSRASAVANVVYRFRVVEIK